MGHNRPLAATPDGVIRRVSEEQMNALRDTRDNLEDCIKAVRRNLNELDDQIAKITAQVVTERTTERDESQCDAHTVAGT